MMALAFVSFENTIKVNTQAFIFIFFLFFCCQAYFDSIHIQDQAARSFVK